MTFSIPKNRGYCFIHWQFLCSTELSDGAGEENYDDYDDCRYLVYDHDMGIVKYEAFISNAKELPAAARTKNIETIIDF